jgi:hypothetical protein
MKLFLAALSMITIAGCTAGNSLGQQKNSTALIEPQYTAGPPTLVYKTRKDYSNNVPILLSEDKKHIVSYPDPRDLKSEQGYPKPAVLQHGYLLDNRGIGLHVAYLKLTYEEYAALEKAPALAQLMDMIIDSDPLTELCNCGNRQAFGDAEKQLNSLISAGKLREACKVIK